MDKSPKKARSGLELIGDTPLVHLKNVYKEPGNLYAKLESLNPGGSMKDRTAREMILTALSEGKLKPGQTVIEMTSGNMGAGLAVVCNLTGNPFIAVMPSGNSIERKIMLEGLGAKVILTEQVDGKPGQVTGKDVEKAAETAVKLAKELNAYYIDQFNNPCSVLGHYKSTGPEIYKDMEGKVDAFVTTVGSGGTFIGVGKYLKEKLKDVKCIAVEPRKAAVLSGKKVEDPKHVIQGTGYCLIPPKWDPKICDWIELVDDQDVIKMKERLAKEEGLYVGYSAAANVVASINALKSKNLKIDANVVTILCDHGLKYSKL